MSQKKQGQAQKLSLLFLLCGALALIYLFYPTGVWDFLLPLRSKKLWAFLLVSIATSFATIPFQTVVQSHFLTPSIFGLDALYVLIQTFLYVVFGGATIALVLSPSLFFILNVVLMVLFSAGLMKWLLKPGTDRIPLMLLIGFILTTLFQSLSTFLQVMMDPNEYLQLQGRLFASFSRVHSDVLPLATLLILISVFMIWRNAASLDVLHLGKDMAQGLGVSVYSIQWQVFFVSSLCIAVSTALVGPVLFLGFIVANVVYQWGQSYQHKFLLLAGVGVSFLCLVGSQWVIEHFMGMKATPSMLIEGVGGIYFLIKIFQKKDR